MTTDHGGFTTYYIDDLTVVAQAYLAQPVDTASKGYREVVNSPIWNSLYQTALLNPVAATWSTDNIKNWLTNNLIILPVRVRDDVSQVLAMMIANQWSLDSIGNWMAENIPNYTGDVTINVRDEVMQIIIKMLGGGSLGTIDDWIANNLPVEIQPAVSQTLGSIISNMIGVIERRNIHNACRNCAAVINVVYPAVPAPVVINACNSGEYIQPAPPEPGTPTVPIIS